MRLLLAAAAIAALGVSSVQAETIYGVLNNDPSQGTRLVTIDSNTRAVTNTVLIQAGALEPIGSIDFRPATGQLYGLGSNSGQLYVINPSTGGVTSVGSPLLNANGAPIGGLIDFNPTVDRIRVVSGTANYRVNPDTGAIAATDGSLSFAAGDTFAGTTPNVVGIGYTNSVAGATTTTLYDINDNGSALDALTRQDPPNNGTLNTVGLLGPDINTGPFGPGGFVGFDISGQTNVAYLTDGQFFGDSRLYTVNLSNGIASDQGLITGLPAGSTVAEIAVAVPEPTTLGLIAGAGLMALRRRRA